MRLPCQGHRIYTSGSPPAEEMNTNMPGLAAVAEVSTIKIFLPGMMGICGTKGAASLTRPANTDSGVPGRDVMLFEGSQKEDRT